MNSQSGSSQERDHMVIQPGLDTLSSLGTEQKEHDTMSEELEKKLNSMVIKLEDRRRTDEPPVFTGGWIESSSVMIARYEKYVEHERKHQTD
ncbi:hypothetical protein BB558_006649, partial [Smittium angustum]